MPRQHLLSFQPNIGIPPAPHHSIAFGNFEGDALREQGILRAGKVLQDIFYASVGLRVGLQ